MSLRDWLPYLTVALVDVEAPTSSQDGQLARMRSRSTKVMSFRFICSLKSLRDVPIMENFWTEKSLAPKKDIFV